MPPKSPSKNVEMLGVVAKGLKALKDEVVFVGGATIDLYIKDSGALPTRLTDDVDCVVELTTRAQFHAFEEKLRSLGFVHPIGERAPMCRWRFSGIIVDVMPTEEKILGFNKRWYKEGVAAAEETVLPNGERIRIFPVSYLLASKLDAFRDRGHEDFLASPDMEDIMSLLDGCPDVEDRFRAASSKARKFLAAEFSALLKNEIFAVSLQGHLNPDNDSQKRLDRCMERVRRLSRELD